MKKLGRQENVKKTRTVKKNSLIWKTTHQQCCTQPIVVEISGGSNFGENFPNLSSISLHDHYVPTERERERKGKKERVNFLI